METIIIVVGLILGLLGLVIIVPIIASVTTVASVAGAICKEDENEG